MKVRDEYPSDVFERDPGLCECGPEYHLGLLRVHARVDERVPGRALDQIGVDAPQSER
jgi:hypothetical protein